MPVHVETSRVWAASAHKASAMTDVPRCFGFTDQHIRGVGGPEFGPWSVLRETKGAFGSRPSARITAEPRRELIRFQQPRRAAGVVPKELLILRRTPVARPNDVSRINVRIVVHPFVLKAMAGGIAYKHELPAVYLRELLIHQDSRFGIAVIDGIPGLVPAQCSRTGCVVENMNAIPKHEVRRAQQDQQTRGK